MVINLKKDSDKSDQLICAVNQLLCSKKKKWEEIVKKRKKFLVISAATHQPRDFSVSNSQMCYLQFDSFVYEISFDIL